MYAGSIRAAECRPSPVNGKSARRKSMDMRMNIQIDTNNNNNNNDDGGFSVLENNFISPKASPIRSSTKIRPSLVDTTSQKANESSSVKSTGASRGHRVMDSPLPSKDITFHDFSSSSTKVTSTSIKSNRPVRRRSLQGPVVA